MKLLPSNQEALATRKLLPVIHIPLDERILSADKAEMRPTQTGDGHYLVERTDDGERILGSRYSEAKFVARQLADLPVHRSCYYYALGFDTGAWLREALQRLPRSSSVICIEPSPERFYRLCTQVDVGSLIADARLHLVLAGNLDALEHASRPALSVLAAHERTCYLPRDGAFLPPGFDAGLWRGSFETRIKQGIKFSQMNLCTSDSSIQNYFQNAYETLACQDWASVREGLRGRPLVVAAIGPSLEFEVERLRALQGRVHIACVDNALRILLARGIRPDFVLQVEWQEHSRNFYHGLDVGRDMVLVFLPGVYPGVIRSWPGPRLVYPAYQIAPLLGEFIDRSTPAFIGTSVGMLGIQFGIHSGAASVHLVGYDFASPMASYFHPGSIGLTEVYPTITRHWSVERLDYEYNRKQQETIEVPGHDGQPVWTAMSTNMDKKMLEKYLAGLPAGQVALWSCSRHGNPIAGVPYRPLAGLAEEIPAAAEPKPRIAPRGDAVDLDRLHQALVRKKDELDRYYAFLDRLHRQAERLRALAEGGKAQVEATDIFLGILGEMHRSPCGWVEHAFITLDPRIQLVYQNESMKKNEIDDREARVQAWVDVLLRFTPVYRSHREFLDGFLDYMLSRTGKA